MKLDKDAKCLWADHYLASLSGTSGHFRPMWEGLFFFINDLSRPCKQCMAGGSQRSPRRLLVPHINLLTSARSLAPLFPCSKPRPTQSNVLLFTPFHFSPSYRTTMSSANLITARFVSQLYLMSSL